MQNDGLSEKEMNQDAILDRMAGRNHRHIRMLFWFRDVRRIMRERKSTVEKAAAQIIVCQKMDAYTNGDLDVAAVLERSEDIYRQAVNIYNNTIWEPRIFLPAYLIGFRLITKDRPEK